MSKTRRFTQFIFSTLIILSMSLSVSQPQPALAQGGDGIKRQVNVESGKVSFIGPESGRSVSAAKALGTFIRPQDPAMALAKRFAPEFGLKDPERDLSEMKANHPDDGRISVRYQQNYEGIPVLGGELIVNTNENGDLYSMNGEMSPDLSLQTQPTVDAAQAKQTALQAAAKWYQKTSADFIVSEPKLWIFDESILRSSTRPVELVWRMEITSVDNSIPLRELVLINAQRGNISLHFNQIDTAWHSSESADRVQTSELPALSSSSSNRVTVRDIEANQSINNAAHALLVTTWYVATTGNNSNSCSATGSPCLTINGAIGKAANGDTIKVAIGTYIGTGTEVVLINKSITLSGGWNTGFTTQSGISTIDAQNARRGVSVSATTSIDHFVIKNGNTGNSPGGGVYSEENVSITIINSFIQNNSAWTGGGINKAYGSLTLNNTTVSNNSTVDGGGSGGGITIYNGNLTLNNTTVSNNLAGYIGGGINIHTGSLTSNNSTISNNSATDSGGGIYVQPGSVSNVSLKNSIIGSNSATTGPDCFGPLTSNGYNLLGNTSSCTVTIKPGDKFNINPVLGTLLQGTLPLLPGSPAINAGNPATCLPTDQRGTARVGTCDMGAFEYQGNGTTAASILPYSGTPQYVTPGSAATSVLKAVVLDADGDTVPGKSVTFTAPASGPSAVFASTGTMTATVTSDGSGIATSPAFFGNSLFGSYVIQATVADAAGPANFSMTNMVQHVKTYTANNGLALPGTLLCDQTQPNCTNGANPHADAAHRYALGTNALYASQHGRNSINNAEMIIVSSVHYDSGYDNAFWNGDQMVYGDAYGFPLADDVVAHEFTHGVTQHESNLFYYYQSGAINESFSDLWGEYYDQINGLGNDTPGYKWLVGEDVSDWIYSSRSMADPPYAAAPDKMSNFYYYQGEDDNGGVHTNSGVNNKAVYLMVDGDTFNGKTVSPLGWEKTIAIYYEVNTNLLISGSDYSDLYYALQQACSNLIGQKGITAADCQEVKDAIDAVEMNAQPTPDFNTDAPLCGSQQIVNTLFFDNLESETSNWIFTKTGTTPRWQYDSSYGPNAHSGLHSLYADDYPAAITDANARLVSLVIPNNAYLHFAHAYGFESNASTYYDGGVLEYSNNGGSTWQDAGFLIDYNGYKGTIFTGAGNPLSGRSAFVGDSHGYISTRLNLASLAGQTVTFRWRMGLNSSGFDWGWWVDDVRIFNCISTINGNVGAAGVTLSYTDGTPKTVTSSANGNYSFPVSNNWSGTVTPTHTCFNFTPPSRSYSNIITNQTGQNYSAALKPAANCADIDVSIGGADQGRFGLPSQGSTRTSFAGVNNGPVQIESTNAVSIMGAERLIYKVNGVNTSFSEMMALPSSQLDNTYWLPWYNNVDLDTQLRFANVSGAEASVHVSIGGVEMPGSPFTLAAGASTRVRFPGINNGPVQIESDQNIVAAERLIYKVNGVNTSFSEMMALPESQLNTTYWLPWYNNVDLDTQLRFANVSSAEASVHVYIGDAEMPGSPFTLEAGASTRRSFAGINNGPVKIESDQNIVAAERLIYKVNGVNTSFSETMGLPDSQLNTTYWLPWYNNVDLDTQLRFANVSGAEASVHVYIGGVEMPGSPFTLGIGESTRVSFAGINNGPVKIESNVNIVAAERLIYKVNNIATSFSEMMGLPASQLDSIYWLPWYNNVDLDTQLRFGVP